MEHQVAAVVGDRSRSVAAHDVAGYWEARGYHNVADPFLEQRYA